MNKVDAFVFVFGVLFTGREVGADGERVAARVEKIRGGMGDGRVAGADESVTDGIADEKGFVVDGREVLRDDCRQGVENGARGDVCGMVVKGREGCTEGDFLEDWVGNKRRKDGKVDGTGRFAGAEENCEVGWRAGSGGWLVGHDRKGGMKVGGRRRNKGSKRSSRNRYRSHVTKDGAVW